jgi:hypothetical protein
MMHTHLGDLGNLYIARDSLPEKKKKKKKKKKKQVWKGR